MTMTDMLASAAITLSITATMACIIAVPVLFQKGSDLRSNLMEGMTEFKVMTEDTWARMMHVRTTKSIKPRQTRQTEAGHCHCYDRE